MLAGILSLLGAGGVTALAFLYPPFGAIVLTAAKSAMAWLSKRSPAELICIVLVIALIAEHVVDDRHAAKLEHQLTVCSKALTDTRSAFDQTVANYRTAAAAATAADQANNNRVVAEQTHINQEASHDYEVRIADARAAAQRLRGQLAAAAGNPGGGAGAPVPALPTAGGVAQGAGEDGFSVSDRLLATEQAIQLDELIKAARKVMAIDPNGPPAPASSSKH